MRHFSIASKAVLFAQLIHYQAVSQNFDDARSIALGSATVAAPSDFAVFSNAAGLAFLPARAQSATASAAMPFLQKDWKKLAAAATFRAGGTGHFALGVSKNGLRDFSENAARLAYGRKFSGALGLGATVDFSSFRSPETEPSTGVSVGIGLLAQASKNVVLGFFAQNPLQTDRFDGTLQPVSMRLGGAFRLGSSASVFSEIEKNLAAPPILKAGIERVFSEKFTARAGVRTQPLRFDFGGRFPVARRVWMDFAAEAHPVLGPTTAVSFLFKSNEKKAASPVKK